MCAKSELINKEWIGQRLDKDFMEYLRSKNIEFCGENGEYHTLVTDGPIFTRRIRMMKSRTISRDKYWFLDTVKYRLSR